MRTGQICVACTAVVLVSFAAVGGVLEQFNVAKQSGVTAAEPEQLGHSYERRGDFIYFDDKRIDKAGRTDLDRFEMYLGRRVTPANDIDAASFEVLSEQYTKDKFAVYYKWISPGWYCMCEVVGADPETFEVLDSDLAKDASNVWRSDVVFPAGDAATAEVVNKGFVWKDRNAVYYQHIPMAGADPRTFRHLDQAFYRDAENVYWSSDRLVGADPDTFRTFGDVPYAADKDRVWLANRHRKDLDAPSFRLFHNHVFADKNGVYVSTKANKVRRADVESFKKVGAVGDLGCTLFRDRESLFILEPAYNEMYRLSREGGEITVFKDIWRTRGGKQVLTGYASATWDGEAFSKATVTVAPGFNIEGTSELEAGKIERLTGTLNEAIKQTGFNNAG